MPSPDEPRPPTTRKPAKWAIDQAASDLYDADDPSTITARAWELMREAQERDDERHDEYDDPDEGGEA